MNTEKCEKKICPKFEKKVTLASQKLYKKLTQQKANTKITKKLIQERSNKIRKTCAKTYCNPGCKGTIFEKGKDISPSAINNAGLTPKNKKILKEILTDIRKDLFKGKNNVLNQNFYEETPKKKVAQLKKQGALSLCSIGSLI